jgi:hypothetical protein
MWDEMRPKKRVSNTLKRQRELREGVRFFIFVAEEKEWFFDSLTVRFFDSHSSIHTEAKLLWHDSTDGGFVVHMEMGTSKNERDDF